MPTLSNDNEDDLIDQLLTNNFQNTSFNENANSANQPMERSNITGTSNPYGSGNSQPSNLPIPTNAPQNTLNRSIISKDSVKTPNHWNFNNMNEEKDKNLLKIGQRSSNISNVKVEYGSLNPISESVNEMVDVEVLETSIIRNQRKSLNTSIQGNSNLNSSASSTSNGNNSKNKMLNS